MVMAAVLLAGCSFSTDTPPPKPGIQCDPPYPTGAPTSETVFCSDPSVMQPARVARVIDGDTIRAIVDGVEEPVRFYGIDTRERGEPCFREARDRTEQLVGDRILLRRDARNKDRNGRLLRYVYMPDGTSIDALLVAEGLAYAWRDDGTLRDALVAVETEAQQARSGCLW
jgi:micrococcal nuclease